MIEIELTKEIHGNQLQAEIGCENLYIANNKIVIVGAVDEKTAKAKYEAHVPIYPPSPSLEEKLASVGLNLDDLKTALGL